VIVPAALFSIGVTTYDRPEMLRQCLQSLLSDAGQDFEIIVGNDNQRSPLSPVGAPLDDPRVRIVNHPRNLGELGNLNALLAEARGRYFSWQADDDFYAPAFLDRIRKAAARFPEADAIFCAYETVGEYVAGTSAPGGDATVLSGSEFLSQLWRGQANTMPLTGMFKRERLEEWGGLPALCQAKVAAMSEHYLLLQVGTLERVVYVPDVLVFFRAHGGSWSTTTSDVDAWETASENFVARAMPLMQAPAFSADYALHFRRVLQRALSSVGTVLARPAVKISLRRELAFLARFTRTCVQGANARRFTSAFLTLFVLLQFARISCTAWVRRHS
jgi:hypothetical protein